MTKMIQWDYKGTKSRQLKVNAIEHFDARGKRYLYGRADQFPRRACFYLDIWIDKTGRLLARCWSHGIDYDWRSFEVLGFPSSLIPEFSGKSSGDDSWIPESLRREYEEWVREEF
ncbi:MAG: hypothetical protein WC855_12065 [Thermodesulfovibrionales bacterium]